MKKKKTIRVHGINGKRYSNMPFFANDEVKKELMTSRMIFKLRTKETRPSGTIIIKNFKSSSNKELQNEPS